MSETSLALQGNFVGTEKKVRKVQSLWYAKIPTLVSNPRRSESEKWQGFDASLAATSDAVVQCGNRQQWHPAAVVQRPSPESLGEQIMHWFSTNHTCCRESQWKQVEAERSPLVVLHSS